MMFFNVLEARKQLLDNGEVYTLRRKRTSTGVTYAVTGNMVDNHILCEVVVACVIEVEHSGDLLPYLSRSGFSDVNTWLSKASPRARTLYKVTRTVLMLNSKPAISTQLGLPEKKLSENSYAGMQ